jgi:hypothetical protein
MRSDKGRAVFKNMSMAELAALLSAGGAETIDRTALTGRFDFPSIPPATWTLVTVLDRPRGTPKTGQ